MGECLVELLELYEYKVDDLEAGKIPKGGWTSLAKLRQNLLMQKLTTQHAKRFRDIDIRFRNLRPGFSGKSEEQAVDLEVQGITLEEEAVQASPEREVLRQLAEAVYWVRLERDLARTGKQLNSGSRDELRLAFTAVRNFESYRNTEHFRSDYNLSRFVLDQPIPPIADPLAHFDDARVAKDVLLEFVRTAYHLSSELRLPPEETVPYWRRFLKRIVDSEGALKAQAATRGPSLQTVKKALEDARKQSAPLHEIRSLERKLQAAASEDRRISMVVEQDRIRFLQAAERLSTLLTRYLPTPKGEAHMPSVPLQILGATDPELRANQVSPEASSFNLRLMPQRVKAWNLDLTVIQTENGFALSFENTEHPLSETEPLCIPWSSFELWAVRRGDYAHFRLEAKEGGALSTLLAEGRVVAMLMGPEQEFGSLRLLRALSARLKGPTEYEAFGPSSAGHYHDVPIDTLQQFARKGLEVVRSRMEQVSGWPPLLIEASKALNLEDLGMRLGRALSDFLNYRPPTRETLGGDIGTTTLAEAPSSIRVGSVVLSLRQQDDLVLVAAAGMAPRRLEDLLVWPVAEGSAVLVRQGLRIAHAFVAKPI